MMSYRKNPLHTQKTYYNIHRDSINITIPINNSLLHNDGHQSPFYTSLIAYQKSNMKKFLKKLVSFNITTLPKL